MLTYSGYFCDRPPMGVQPCPLPTAVLSAQTGYPRAITVMTIQTEWNLSTESGRRCRCILMESIRDFCPESIRLKKVFEVSGHISQKGHLFAGGSGDGR